ncbi:Zinc finger, BED-type [Parasponia andersonii]|uniref:Zinc finger, BED-type n=1 Tax=Parasponia andersonii TaxID=3476 RepID=A0A2P5C421_PARAD|nr:Zinc finger, BED-type [Parasponia andersonii]
MAPVRSPGLVDPGWEHGVAQDEKKKKVQCNYCGKVVSGGIYRLKQHLARVSGEVTYCNKAPEEVYLRMKENLEGCRSNKKPRHPRDNGQPYLNFHSNDDEELEVEIGHRSKGKQLMDERNLVMKCTPLRSLGYVDPGWEHCVAQDERKKKSIIEDESYKYVYGFC